MPINIYSDSILDTTKHYRQIKTSIVALSLSDAKNLLNSLLCYFLDPDSVYNISKPIELGQIKNKISEKISTTILNYNDIAVYNFNIVISITHFNSIHPHSVVENVAISSG